MHHKNYMAVITAIIKTGKSGTAQSGGQYSFSVCRRWIALLLIACLLLPMLAACGKGKQEAAKLNEGKLTLENTRVGSDTLALSLGQYPLMEEAECRIAPVENPPLLPGADIRAFSFEIDTEDELLSVMELTIPYDAAAFQGQGVQGNIAAAYYNEEAGAWEPVSFRINEDTQTITIYTDHLSVFGCFEVTNPNTREAYAAYAIPSFAMTGMMGTADANGIITTAVTNGGTPGEDAVEAGLSILDNVLNFSSAGVDIAAFLSGLGGSNGATGASLLGDIGEHLGNLGLLCSIAQVGYGMYNIYNGNTDAVFPCYANALKTGVGYTAGKLGARLFSVAMVGVLAMEYSVNTFAQEALSGRKDIYNEAYRLYYESHGVKRSARDWASVLLKAKEGAASANRYQLRVEGLVQRYAEEFWQDELRIAEYQEQAQKHGFTGGGGLNERIKAEISNDFKLELYRGVLQDAFQLIAQKEAIAAERALLAELNFMKTKLNTPCALELYDSTLSETKPNSHLAGARAAIKLPDTVTDAESWSAILDEQGNGSIRFTLLGYLMAKGPKELEIYGKDAAGAEPTLTLPFDMETATTRLDIGEEPLSLEELLGDHQGTVTIMEVFISDAIMSRAENDPLRFDNEDLQFYGDCDATMLVALKEAEGQVSPCRIQIRSEDPSSGKNTIVLFFDDTSTQYFDNHYANGVFTMEEETNYVEGFNVSLRLSAGKDADGTIRLTGAYEAWPPEYENDLRMYMTIKTDRAAQ